jgi:oligo-alginate lyase
MPTRLARPLTVTILILVACASAAEPRPLPPHPRLLLNREGIDQLRQKIQHEPWSTVWANYEAGLVGELKPRIELPPRGGNWSHNYVCPTHGARLKQGRPVGPWQWEHHCPVGPHVLRGDPSLATLDFDGNGISAAHADFALAVRDLGVAWQVTGKTQYAERARAILLEYAAKYLAYTMHDNRGRVVQRNGGRVASQSLTEASWLVPMAQGADLIWDTLAPSQRDELAEKLFRPAIEETILNRSTKPVIHNIQCHRNSAVGLVGFLLGDSQLIDGAIDGLSGYRANMRAGVQADGVWFEGAWGYHFFTIRGIWPLTEAARNCGSDLYGPELQRLFDAPLRLATPDFRLPAFNDSGEVTIARDADYYELAYARYQVPAYAALLAPRERSGRMALWFGVRNLAGGELPQLASRNAETSGYAILQRGEGSQATWLCLKYGPHGGGHGHFDKNHFVLYARGQAVMPDAGSHAYGSPLHRDWDKTTFAHNTLVVDETTQTAATGKCLCFGSEAGVDYAMVDAGDIYSGVRFVRTAALVHPELIVFVDHVQADKPHTLDLVCHHQGQWDRLPAGREFVPAQVAGYKCLQDATSRMAEAGITLSARLGEDRASRIVLAANAPTEVITGTGVGSSTEQRVPLAVFRRVAQETTYVWAVALDGSPVTLTTRTASAGSTTVAIQAAQGNWQLTSNPDAGTVQVATQ